MLIEYQAARITAVLIPGRAMDFFQYFSQNLSQPFKPRQARSKFKFLLLLFLTGCAPTVPIADISQQSLDQSIQVKGKVITVAPMINQSAYEIQDDRGTVWILTKKQMPKLDSEVTVTGKVKFESIKVEGGEELGERYLEEE